MGNIFHRATAEGTEPHGENHSRTSHQCSRTRKRMPCSSLRGKGSNSIFAFVRCCRKWSTSTGSTNVVNVKRCCRCQLSAWNEQTKDIRLTLPGKNSNAGTFQVGHLQGRTSRFRRITLQPWWTPHPWTSMTPRAWSATEWTMMKTCCFVTVVMTDTIYIAVPRS